MSRIITVPTENNLDKLAPFCDGIIIGVKGLSVNLGLVTTNYEDYIKYAQEKNLDIYISLNKNMVNDDLKHLEETMINLSALKIAGVIFYDIAVVNINKRLNLNLNLVWNQEHFTTNYFTSNFWNNEGVTGMHVSSELTLKEIEEIIDNSKMRLLITIFGHLPMFNSFRHLVKNYLTTFDIKNDKKVLYMEEKGKMYPIIDDEQGTTVYSECVLNALDEYLILNKHDIDFVVDTFLLEDESVLEVLKMIKTSKIDNNYIEQLFKKVDKGFFYKETIYKVKK